ncbi:uncharacterized protein BDZ83DRAFT_18253 [Colletotrichum acutatum]|uniref:Uncharacterized protein n=1 Tax=Glomerella acutata TaxID=27357 RepID=A0AAD8UGE2_GLOAC|nr:uncharacterized protein BDZ83DRAFT_18253 [Colletotrichum acutatum]KAK1718790.1 hypothetical protein BDZ83DRAFT_18253 [Colletotrichum acutatum]
MRKDLLTPMSSRQIARQKWAGSVSPAGGAQTDDDRPRGGEARTLYNGAGSIISPSFHRRLLHKSAFFFFGISSVQYTYPSSSFFLPCSNLVMVCRSRYFSRRLSNAILDQAAPRDVDVICSSDIYPLFHSDDSTNPPPEMIFGKEDIRSTMWTGWVPSVTTSILVSPCKEEEPDAVDEVQSIRGERPTAEHDQSARHSSSFRRKVGQQMPTIRYRAGMESYLLERGKRGRTQLPSLVSKTPAVRRRDASKHHATSAQHTEMPSD